MCLLSMVENMIGLVFGSLPAIGKTLRLYDRPKKSQTGIKLSERRADHSFGGTPFIPLRGPTGPHDLHFVPDAKGGNQTRIWSEFNTVASTLLDDEQETSSGRGGRIEKQLSFDVEEQTNGSS